MGEARVGGRHGWRRIGKGEEDSFVKKIYYKIISWEVIWIAKVIWIINPKSIPNMIIWWSPFKLPAIWIDCQLPNVT